jgi:hypothetical protein
MKIVEKNTQRMANQRPGMVVHTYNSSYEGGIGRRDGDQRLALGKNMRPCLKNN